MKSWCFSGSFEDTTEDLGPSYMSSYLLQPEKSQLTLFYILDCHVNLFLGKKVGSTINGEGNLEHSPTFKSCNDLNCKVLILGLETKLSIE